MGPLKGFKIIEVGGIGPGPFCGMMLADMGAEIIRIDRKGKGGLWVEPRFELLHRGRKSVAVDLSKSEGVELVLRLIEGSDALIEGFRPGVMERLGLGPGVCLARNKKLVFGRMTGWGQEGPLSGAAGHDINYISLSSALHSIGHPEKNPSPPLNLVGDFGGGGMLLAFGLVCGMLEAQKSGEGQVVDAAMVDGSAVLMTMMFGLKAAGMWADRRGVNLLDGGAHFYDTYETKDGKWVSIGSIEPQFYALLLEKAEIEDPDFKNQLDFSKWPELKKKLTDIFKSKTRDEWCAIMEGTDICFAPVLSMSEAPKHPHNFNRGTFVEVDGIVQPGPAPRFSRTQPEIQGPPPTPGDHTKEVLLARGFSEEDIENLMSAGAI